VGATQSTVCEPTPPPAIDIEPPHQVRERGEGGDEHGVRDEHTQRCAARALSAGAPAHDGGGGSLGLSESAA